MNHRELDLFIQKYKNGEQEAFDIIYHETKKTVYLSIAAIIKDRLLIEDLMQDTYLRAINSLSSYKIGTNFKAWICRIGRNLAINMYNKRKRESILDPQENNLVFDTPIDQKTPLLDTAIRILNDHEREIVIYHIVLNFTFKAISEILDLPLGTIFWTYQKAMKKIKNEM